MSLNIVPVYGKQYIRYAETWSAASDSQAASPRAVAAGTTVGTVDIPEFAVVVPAGYAGANTVCLPADLATPVYAAVGVSQSYIPTSSSQPHTARQASIATSGSLLVKVDSANTFEAADLNTQLRINNYGLASDGANAVTVNGTTPLIRDIIDIGGSQFVLVTFR